MVYIEQDSIKEAIGALDDVTDIAGLDHHAWILPGVTGQIAQEVTIPDDHLRDQFCDRDLGFLGQQFKRLPEGESHSQAPNQHMRIRAPL